MLSLHNEETNGGREFPPQPVETNESTFSPMLLSVQKKVELMSLVVHQVEGHQSASEDVVVQKLQDLLLELQSCLLQQTALSQKCKQQEGTTLKERIIHETLEDYSLVKENLKQRVKNIRPLLDAFEQSFDLLTSKPKNGSDLSQSSTTSNWDGGVLEIEHNGLLANDELVNESTPNGNHLSQMKVLEKEMLSKVTAIESQIMSNLTLTEVDRSLIENQFQQFHESCLKPFTTMKMNLEHLEYQISSQFQTTGTHREIIEQDQLKQVDLETLEATNREDELLKTIFELNLQFQSVQEQLFESQQHEKLLQNSFTIMHDEKVQLIQKNEELMKSILQIEEKYRSSLVEIQTLRSKFDLQASYSDKIADLEDQLRNTRLCLKEYEDYENHFYSIAGAWNAEFKEIGRTLDTANSKELLLESLIETMVSLQAEEIQDRRGETSINDMGSTKNLHNQLEELKNSLKEAKKREESLSLLNYKMSTELEDGKIQLQLVVEHAEKLVEKLQNANVGQPYVDSIHLKLREKELTIAKFKEQCFNYKAKEYELNQKIQHQLWENESLEQKLSELISQRHHITVDEAELQGLRSMKEGFLKVQEKLLVAETREREHNQTVTQLNLELEKTKAVLDSAFKKVELFDSTIRDLGVQLEKSKSDVTVNSDLAGLQTELEETIQLLAHATEREAELENTVSQLQHELVRSQAVVDNLSEDASLQHHQGTKDKRVMEQNECQLDPFEAKVIESSLFSIVFELNEQLNLAKQLQFDYERTINLLESAVKERLVLNEENQNLHFFELQKQKNEYDTMVKEHLKALFDINIELEKKSESLLEKENCIASLEAYIAEISNLSKTQDKTISQLTEELTVSELNEKESCRCLFELAGELNRTMLALTEQRKITRLFESSVNDKLSEIQEMGNGMSWKESILINQEDLYCMEQRMDQLESMLEILQSAAQLKDAEIEALQNKHRDQTSRLEQISDALGIHIRTLAKWEIVDIHGECADFLQIQKNQDSDTFDTSVLNLATFKIDSWAAEELKNFDLLRTEMSMQNKIAQELQETLGYYKQEEAVRETLQVQLQQRECELLDTITSLQNELQVKAQQLEESLSHSKGLEESIEKLKQRPPPSQNTQESNYKRPTNVTDSVTSKGDKDLAQIDTTRILKLEKLEASDVNCSRNSVSSLDHDRDSAVALDEESDGNEGRKALPYSESDLSNKLAEVQAELSIAKSSRRNLDDQWQMFKNKLKNTIAQLVRCDQREAFDALIASISNTLEDPAAHMEEIIACFDKPETVLEAKDESRRLTFGNIPTTTVVNGSNSKQYAIIRGRAFTISGNSAQEITKLQNDLSLYAKEIESLKSQKANYEKQCRSFQENIMVSQTRESKLSREIHELRSRLEAHKVESMNALTALQAKYRESVAELETKSKQQIEEFEKELFVAKKRIIRLKEQVSSTEKVCADAVSLTEQLETELARTWKEKRTVEKQLLESQQRYEDLCKDLRTKDLELTSQKQLYDSKLKDMDLKIRDKVKSITIARRATIINSPERRGSFYQQLRSKWTGSVIDESNLNNPRAMNELEARFQDEVDMHVTTNRLLQVELTEVQTKNAELEQVKEAIEMQLNELRTTHDRSERALAKLRREAEENQRATLVSLQRAQTEKQSSARIELATIQAERASQQRIISELRKELSTIRDDQIRKSKELLNAKQEIEVLKRLSNSDNNEGANAVLEVLTREKLILETKVNELEAELDDVLTKNVDFAMQLAAIK